MPLKIQKILSQTARNTHASPIREMLALTQKPNITSFAGGLPAPESFPNKKMAVSLMQQAYNLYGSIIFQYAPTEGFPPFVDQVKKRLIAEGFKGITENSILVTSGSQQALLLIAEALINPGDIIITESPTYLGALQAFNHFRPRYITVKTSLQTGIDPNHLADTLKEHPKTKIVYLVTDFQNPMGTTLSLQTRDAIADIASKHQNVIFIADSPYKDLRYKGNDVPSLHSIVQQKGGSDNIVELRSFSKIFAPGSRIGYIVCENSELIKYLSWLKQGADLQASTISQALIAVFMREGYLDLTIKQNISLYTPRLEAMAQAMDKSFPSYIHHTSPEGGMFLFTSSSDPNVDMEKLLPEAIDRCKVAYVPGTSFFPEYHMGDRTIGRNTARFNFTNTDPERTRQIDL